MRFAYTIQAPNNNIWTVLLLSNFTRSVEVLPFVITSQRPNMNKQTPAKIFSYVIGTEKNEEEKNTERYVMLV